ncbi:MAG TPA: hypothetical protein VNX40_01485 [Mucilaginibacter sp.]|jgi:hypothetical protein|nr:hypothetical protein [Mucilaginibacter sp.]
MKKLVLLSAIAISGFMINTANAQIGIRVGIGYAPQRAIYATNTVAVEAPVNDDGDDYYYLPDLGVYYNVTDQDYVYFDGYEWVTTEYLPGQYHDYDWRNARRFEVRAERPYMNDDFYRSKYEGNRFEGWARANDNDRNNGGYAYNGDRDGNRNFNNGQNRYNQPAQYNRGAYSQPVQYNKGNDQHFEANRGAYNQPAQQRRDNNQGFNRGQASDNHQNDRNRGNDNRGGDARYSQNNRQNGNGDHRMSKF